MMPRVGLGMLLFLLGSLAWHCTSEDWRLRRVYRIVEVVDSSHQYEHTQDANPDLVFVVEFDPKTFPEMLGPWRYPLKHNPAGRRPGFPWRSTSWAACGGEGGANGSLSVYGDLSAGESITVKVARSSRDRDGKSEREIAGELQVPWLGEARHELGHGAWVRARFIQPE